MKRDFEKIAANALEHGVRFERAAAAFADSLSVTVSNPDHSVGEARYLLIKRSLVPRMLVVVHRD